MPSLRGQNQIYLLPGGSIGKIKKVAAVRATPCERGRALCPMPFATFVAKV